MSVFFNIRFVNIETQGKKTYFTWKINVFFIFGRANDLYLYVYNQLFTLFYYFFKFLTP